VHAAVGNSWEIVSRRDQFFVAKDVFIHDALSEFRLETDSV